MESIRDYWVKKLLFPRKFIVDRPGVIINCVARKYGGIKSRHRSVYYFEELIAKLQQDTVKSLGDKKARQLWYQIGKDVGTQYALLSKAKKIPSFLMEPVLKYIFAGFKNSGCSAAENFTHSPKDGTINLIGRNNIICRKSGIGDFFSGVTAGLLSFLTGRKYGGILKCKNCPEKCNIVARVNSDNYLSDISLLETAEEYNKVNFPEKHFNGSPSYSLKDFIRFEKVAVSPENKHVFCGHVIIPSPIQMFGQIIRHYKKEEFMDIMEGSLIKNSQLLIKNVLPGDSPSGNLNFIRNMLSAFGWGIMEHRTRGDDIIVDFFHAPFNKYGFSYQAFVLNGYLNQIFGEEFELRKMESQPGLCKITLRYTKLK